MNVSLPFVPRIKLLDIDRRLASDAVHLQQQQQHKQQHQQQGNHKHTDWRQRMTSRLTHAAEYCRVKATSKGKVASNQTTYSFKTCPLISTRRPSKFCPIAKIGSTFWTRFFMVLQDSLSDTLESPYRVPLSVINDRSRCDSSKNSVSDSKVVSAMFVREPFSRIFSAYVDKLVSPNPVYWSKWGRPALADHGVGKDQLRCGQDVTFRQFLRFTTRRLHRRDNHVIPMAAQCDPCRTSYDVIGTMETFSEDLKYLMRLVNVTFRPDVDLSRGAKLDAIFDSIQGPFGWLGRLKDCVSTAEVGRRIWRKLQLRGLISSSIDYPLKDRDLASITLTQFNDVAVKAFYRSTDKKLLSLQKQQAFTEAFRTVSEQDLREFVAVYRQDFEAFGYDPAPASVFQRPAGFIDTKAFDFNRPWEIPDSLLLAN